MLRANYVGEGYCYTAVRHRLETAMALILSAHRILRDASRVRRLRAIKSIDFTRRLSLPRVHKLMTSLDPIAIDAVRIATAFENVFKARLLLHGFVVHRIDRRGGTTAKMLAKIQHTRPLRIRDVKRAEGCRHGRRIDYVFRLLENTTLGCRVMVGQAAYRGALRLPVELLDAFDQIVHQRNAVHFLAGSVDFLNARFIEELTLMVNSFNRIAVPQHNRLVHNLGFPDRLFLSPIGDEGIA
jgi:hypothetical protein